MAPITQRRVCHVPPCDCQGGRRDLGAISGRRALGTISSRSSWSHFQELLEPFPSHPGGARGDAPFTKLHTLSPTPLCWYHHFLQSDPPTHTLSHTTSCSLGGVDQSRGRRSQTVGADCLSLCHPRDRWRPAYAPDVQPCESGLVSGETISPSSPAF